MMKKLIPIGLGLAILAAAPAFAQKPGAKTQPKPKTGGTAGKTATESKKKVSTAKSKGTASNAKFKTTPGGLEYKLFASSAKGARKKPVLDDQMRIHVLIKNNKGDKIISTYEAAEPAQIPLMAPIFKGDPMEGFAMLAEGDSAVFMVSADSFFAGQTMPHNIESGSKLSMHVKLLNILTAEEIQKQREEQEKEVMRSRDMQLQSDTLAIREYLDKAGLKAQRTPSGLYYVIQNPGAGNPALPGKTVSVHYTGKLLSNGRIFDSSRDRGKPFSFGLGKGAVIQGWDEGIALLKKGATATLFIPSVLGYGGQDMGAIPANSVLIFDVELTDVSQ